MRIQILTDRRAVNASRTVALQGSGCLRPGSGVTAPARA